MYLQRASHPAIVFPNVGNGTSSSSSAPSSFFALSATSHILLMLRHMAVWGSLQIPLGQTPKVPSQCTGYDPLCFLVIVLCVSFTRNKICWDKAKILTLSTGRISQVNHQYLVGTTVLWAMVMSIKKRIPTNLLWVKRS